jgi:hypothetical protein
MGQQLITMEPETICSSKLAQNDMPAERPFTISQKIPVPAPDLHVCTGGSDSV